MHENKHTETSHGEKGLRKDAFRRKQLSYKNTNNAPSPTTPSSISPWLPFYSSQENFVIIIQFPIKDSLRVKIIQKYTYYVTDFRKVN